MVVRLLRKWPLTLVWTISLILYLIYKAVVPYVEGPEDLLFGTIEFIVLAPLYGIVFVGSIISMILRMGSTAHFLLSGVFFCCFDLLRMHIKKYREYKRIAMRAKKEA